MSTHACCVLIIDSDLDELTHYQHAIQQAGMVVKTIPAIEFWSSYPQSGPFDLIVCSLPTLELAQVIPLARFRHTYPDVPLVVIVDSRQGNDIVFTPEHLDTIIRASIQKLVFKPFSSTELPHIIFDILQKHQNPHAPQYLTTLQRFTTLWQSLFTKFELPHLCQIAVDMIGSELGADKVAVFLWNDDKAALQMAAGTLACDALCTQQGSSLPALTDWLIQHPLPLLMNSKYRLPPELEHLDNDGQSGSALFVPLIHEGQLLGVIVATRTPTQAEYDEEDQEVLVLLARQISTAIEYTRRYTVTAASATRHRDLLRYATDAMFLLDTQGHHILDANLAAERLSGYSRVALLHLEPRALLTSAAPLTEDQVLSNQDQPLVPDLPPWLTQTYLVEKAGHSSDDGEEIEALLHTKSGYGLPVALTISRITCDDQPVVLVIARDISKRWRQSQQLVQSEKLAAIGRLVSSVAHEINNPLQAIHNSLHLLISRSLDNEKRQRYLVMTQEEVERLINIVRRVLETYRPSRDGMRPTDLHNLLHAVMALINQQLHDSGVRVVYDLYPGLPLVSGIGSHLKQVYMSLILNAIESMPDGGVLTIRSYVTSKADTEQTMSGDQAPSYPLNAQLYELVKKHDYAIIEFRDTGRGIPPDQITKIFEPFYTTRSDGLGLGLAISYGIVEQHQGKLTVSSIVGEGTTFRLYLPVAT